MRLVEKKSNEMKALLEESFVESKVYNQYANYHYEEDIIIGVIKIEYLDLETSKKCTQMRKMIQQEEKALLLTDARELHDVSVEARAYATSDTVSSTVKAHAILKGEYLDAFAMNMFLKILKPAIPTKIFSDKEKAFKWLNSFK